MTFWAVLVITDTPVFRCSFSQSVRLSLKFYTLGRNLALNLYREQGFENMAQAQRRAGQGFKLLKSLFRMK
jgi:hypothetical protein